MKVIIAEEEKDIVELHLKEYSDGVMIVGTRGIKNNYVIAEISHNGEVKLNIMGISQLNLTAPQVGVKK